MAKLQVLIAMTLDGSIPAEDDPLLQWMRDDKDGFSYGRDKCTRRLYPGYPLVDFMCEKDMSDPSILYQAEIHDEESIELLRGLSVYHLIDEMIIFLFPSTRPENIMIPASINDKFFFNICFFLHFFCYVFYYN